jgi:chromosome segregation ATPase
MKLLESGKDSISEKSQRMMEDYERRISELGKEKSSLQDKVRSLESALQMAQEQLKEKELLIVNLQGQVQSLQANLGGNISQLQSKLNEALSECSNLRAKIDSLLEKHEIDMNSQRDKFLAAENEWNREREGLELALKSSMENSQATIDQLRREIEDLKKGLVGTTESLSIQFQEEKSKLLLKHETELNKMREELERLKESHQLELKALIQRYEKQLKEQLDGFQAQLEERNQNLSQKDKVLAERAARIKELESECEQLRQKLIQVEKSLEESNLLSKDSRGKFDELVNKMKMEMKEKESLLNESWSKKYKDLEDELRKLKDEHKTEILRVSVKLTEERQAVERMKNEVISKLESQLANWQEKLRAAQEEWENKLKSMEGSSSSELSMIRANYEDQIRLLTETYEKTLKELKQKSAEDLKSLSSSLEEKHKKELKELRDEQANIVADLKNRHAKELEDLRNANGAKINEINENHQKKMKATLESHEKEMKALEARVAGLERDLQAVRESLEKMTQERDALKETIGKMRREVEDATREKESVIEEYSRRSKELEEENRRREQNLQSAEGKMREKVTQLLKAGQKEQENAVSQLEAIVARVRSSYEEKIKILDGKYNELKTCFNDRPSRPEDVNTIQILQRELIAKTDELVQAEEKFAFFRDELINRENNYNKVFNNNPIVGVLDPMANAKVTFFQVEIGPRIKLGWKRV